MNYCNILCVARNKIFNQEKCRKCNKLFDFVFHDKDLVDAIIFNSFFGKKKLKERLPNISDKDADTIVYRIQKYFDKNEFF